MNHYTNPKGGIFLTTRKYGLWTILIYAICYFSPALFPTVSSALWATIVFYLGGAFFVSWLYRTSQSKLDFEMQPKDWKTSILWGILGIFLAIILQNIAIHLETALFGESGNSQNTANILSFIQSNLLFVLAVSVGGPILEEFVFRRALIGILQEKTPLWFATIVSSLLFAVMHDDGHILLYTSLGIFFSLLYIKTGRIWTSIISHVGMNSLVVFIGLLSK